MAYGLLLYKEIETPLGSQRVEIYKDGYSGTAIEIAGLHADGITISKDSQSLTQPITTSVLTLRLSDCNEVDYSQFFTPNATLFKVVWQTRTGGAWSTRWTGFITPDSYTENLAYRDTLTLTARDNLGRLNDYDFDLAQGQMLSVRAILTAAMTKAGVAMGLTFTTAKVATSPATVLAVDGLVNTTLLQGMTWHAAVELLLTGLGLTLAWNDGNAFEVRDITQAPANTQAAFFINKSGYRQIRPAWKNLTLAQDYGLRSNFYEGQFTKDQCGDNPTFSIPYSSKWDYGGTIALLNPYKGAAYPYETIYLPIQGGDGILNRIAYTFPIPANTAPIKVTFTANNTAWINDNGIVERTTLGTREWPYGGYVPTPYAIRFRCNIFCNVGGTTYILRDEWKVYDESTIEDAYLFFMMPPALTEQYQVSEVDADNEVSIYIGTPPGAGLVSVVFYEPNVCGRDVIASRSDDVADYALAQKGADWVTPYAKITSLKMSIEEGISGRQMKVAVNPDHNMQGDFSVSLGQVPTGKGNTLLYLGGLFYDDTYYTPLTAFAKAQNGTNYDLLELVGREYITYQNAAYNAISGTMKAASAFRFDKGITFDGNAYRIVGASLAILSNTLSAQLLQQEASFDTAAHTVEAVDEEGNARAATTTGSIAQGAGFDSEILRHLSLQVINEGLENEETIMVCDLTFASEHGLVAGGIGGTGGGGGGGSLADLADVTLTALAGGDILRYDALTSHWVNGPLQVALSALTDVAIATTPSNGQALVYDSTAGKWKPGNVDTTITAQMILTALGNTPVARATADASGNTITSTYLAQSSFTAANIASTLGNTYVANANYASSAGVATSATYDTHAKLLATQEWVTGQGYITSSALSGYMLSSDFTAANIVSTLGNTAVAKATYAYSAGVATSATYDTNAKMLATQDWVTARGYLTSTDIADMATQTWVGQQGYLTSSALTGYATETWVTGTALANYATQSWVGSYFVSTITDSTVQANLTIGSSSSGKLLTVYGTTSSALAIRSGSSNVANLYHDGSWLQVSSALYVQGNIAASGNIVAGSASDARLKDDITAMDINAAADVLAGLRPVDFRWNADAARLGGLSGVSRGFIAQEYNRIIPNATRKIWGEYDAIDYDQTIPYLTAGWQQHNMRLRILEGEIRALKEENAALRRALDER